MCVLVVGHGIYWHFCKRGSWCCGRNPRTQSVNVNIVNALRSCRSLFGLGFECPVVNSGAINQASPVSPATMLVSNTPDDSADAGSLVTGLLSGLGRVPNVLPNVQVDVTKHHDVHMYESRWKKLFFSLLHTIKEEAKPRSADQSDPEIDETVGYYNFLHKNDMKDS